ncbi:unnamed protein product [Rodentolepis nana]|uniref:P53 domain-containing protein n=1 Tax=Rodentolepis nana TaxID=102285 RepID=A0A0R3T467_RODNA|nr:unnamed protein product [Rodentolepis nana]
MMNWSFDTLESVKKLLSPLHTTHPSMSVQSRHPFLGQYDFHLDFTDDELAKAYRLYTGPNGKRVLFVKRDKPFVMRTRFRLPPKSSNLRIRVIPLFTAHSRRNEAIIRCPNHACESEVKSPSTLVLNPVESHNFADASRSLINIQNLQTNYCYLEGHLTALLHLDHHQLAMAVQPPSPCLEGQQGPAMTGLHICSWKSQSPTNGSMLCYPKGFTTEDIVCTIGCYNSCFGALSRGGIELIVRLEELPGQVQLYVGNAYDPRLPPIVYGIDRLEIHCSATPARDIRHFSETNEEAIRSAFENFPLQNQSILGAIESSSSLASLLKYRQGLSTSLADISDRSLNSSASGSKRRLTQTSSNLGGEDAFQGVGYDDEYGDHDVDIGSQASSATSEHLAGLPTPASIELQDGNEVKKVYYLVVTTCMERAKQLRFYDDASAAFDGRRMDSRRFVAYGKECLEIQNRIAELYSAYSENCQPSNWQCE